MLRVSVSGSPSDQISRRAGQQGPGHMNAAGHHNPPRCPHSSRSPDAAGRSKNRSKPRRPASAWSGHCETAASGGTWAGAERMGRQSRRRDSQREHVSRPAALLRWDPIAASRHEKGAAVGPTQARRGRLDCRYDDVAQQRALGLSPSRASRRGSAWARRGPSAVPSTIGQQPSTSTQRVALVQVRVGARRRARRTELQ